MTVITSSHILNPFYTRAVSSWRSHGIQYKKRAPRCVQCDDKHLCSNAVASSVDAVGSFRTLNDGAHFEHAKNKCHGLKLSGHSKRVKWGGCMVGIAVPRNSYSAGTHKGLCANTMVVRGACTDMLQRFFEISLHLQHPVSAVGRM